MISEAWDQVKQSTIQNCFIKCGFSQSNATEDENIDDIDIWPQIKQSMNLNITFDDYTNCDNDLIASETIDEESIVQNIIEKQSNNQINSDDTEIESDTEVIEVIEKQKVTAMDAIQAVAKLREYFLDCPQSDNEVMNEIQSINSKIFKNIRINAKQTMITDYFNKQ